MSLPSSSGSFYYLQHAAARGTTYHPSLPFIHHIYARSAWCGRALRPHTDTAAACPSHRGDTNTAARAALPRSIVRSALAL